MLGFFTTKVMAYICAGLGIVIVSLSVALWAQDVRLGKAQNDRDKAQNDVAKALVTIKGQIALLTECDQATKALKTESDKRVAAADQALAKAQAEARRYQQANQKRDAALKAPTPPGVGCAEAVARNRKDLQK